MTNKARQRMDSINKGARLEDMPLRVAIYARVSTESEEQRKSIQNQIETYRSMIEENPNWQYVGLYSDEGITGTRMDIRDQFNTMIEDARRGKMDLVITKSVSRFARNLKDFLEVVDKLKDLGVIVKFDEEHCLNCRTNDHVMLEMFALGAAMEARSAQERTRVAFQNRIKQGAVFGNSKILGYTKNQCKLVVDEGEAQVVRTIFDLFVHKRMGLRAIRRELRQQGMTRSDGSYLCETTIANILDNPKYKGFFCGGKSEKSVEHDKRVMRERKEWVLHEDPSIPAIVSPELWDEAALLRKRRREKFNQQVQMPCNEGKYRYSGKIVGGNVSGLHYTRILNRYKGQNREGWQPRNYKSAELPGVAGPTVYSDELDALINCVLQGILGDYTPIVEDLMEKYAQAVGNSNAEERISGLKKKIAEVEVKRNRLLVLYENGGLTTEGFKERDASHQQEIRKLENAISVLEDAKVGESELQRKLEDIRRGVELVLQNPVPSKETIDTLVRQITVCKESTRKRLVLDLELNSDIHRQFEILRAEPSESDCVLVKEEKFCICYNKVIYMATRKAQPG